MAIKDDMEDVQEAVINELITENGITNTLADDQVTESKILNNAVTTNKIANGAVTAAKLGNDVSLTVADGDITPAKLDRAYLESTGGTVTGNVGISNSSPASQTAGAQNLVVGTSGATGITIVSSNNNNGSIFFADGTSGNEGYRGYLQYTHTSDALVIGTSATERMRITSQGHVILSNVPTSASGLSTGTIYSDGGTLKIV